MTSNISLPNIGLSSGLSAADTERENDLSDLLNTDAVEQTNILEQIRGHIKIERLVLNLLFFVNLCCSIVVLAIPDSRVNESFGGLGSVTDNSIESFSSGLVTLQYGFAIAITVINVICIGLGMSPTSPHNSRFILIMCLKIGNISLMLPAFAYPTPVRIALLYISLALSIVELILVLLILRKYAKYCPQKAPRDKHESQVAQLPENMVIQFVSRAEILAHLHETRRRYYIKHRRGKFMFLAYFGLILILSYGNFVFEFKKTISTSDEFFDTKFTAKLNNEATLFSEYGKNRTDSVERVILVVIDGLSIWGYNQPVFQELIKNASFYPDSIEIKMRANLPSMSVPNWLSLVTGVKPELTGVWGNLAVPETRYDSVFREARLFNLNRGITSSAWFTTLIRSQLPLLCGDGTVDLAYDPSETGPRTNNPTDERRGSVLLEAVKSYPEMFFLAHFSDVDFQGHYYGQDPKYNKKNTYVEALRNKTKIMFEMLPYLDSKTVLIITSDHGMMAKGGHGGTNDDVMDVMTVVYQNGSRLRDKVYGGASFKNPIWQLIDIPATVSALLGLPVPRQCEGVFIDPVMPLVPPSALSHHYRDLFLQKQAFVKTYMEQTLHSPEFINQTLLTSKFTGSSNDVYVSKIKSLLNLYAQERTNQINSEMTRNILVTFLLIIILFFFGVLMMGRATFAEPFLIWSKQKVKLTSEGEGESSQDLLGYDKLDQKKRNTTAFIWVLAGSALYLGLTILVFKILYIIYGYPDIWDSTYLHSPEAVISYAAYIIFTGTILSIILIRSYGSYYDSPPARSSSPNAVYHTLRMARFWLTGSKIDQKAQARDQGMIYLCRVYLLLAIALILLVLFVFQSTYTFLVPYIFRIKYVQASTWGFRFRVITVHFMLMPLTVASLISYLMQPNSSVTLNLLDGVYCLKISKDLRRNRLTPAATTALLKLLAPENTKKLNDITPFDLFRNPEKTVRGARLWRALTTLKRRTVDMSGNGGNGIQMENV